MAFPTYVGKGTFQSTTIALGTTPSLPASLATNDLLIAVVSTPNDSTVYSVDGDWTLLANIGTGTDNTAGAVDVWVWYARYNGVALGAFGTTTAKLKCQQVYAFRSATTPTITATSVQSTAATAWTLPSITTTVADSFIFFAIGNDRDLGSSTNVSGYTNANLASITEIHDETVATGVGGGIATIYAQKATTGSTGTTSATSAASNTAAFVTFAISAPQAYTIVADTRSYAYTGGAANLLDNKKVIADPVSFSYTGGAANLLDNKKVVADPVTFSYTGGAANLLDNKLVVADAVSFSYTGGAANTIATRRIVADGTSYSYTGTVANTLFNRKIVADGVAYSYAGGAANLSFGKTIVAAGTTYTVTGQDATLKLAAVLQANSGTYSYSGTDAQFKAGTILVADAVSYSYTGQAASFTTARSITADSVSYSLTGQAVTFTATRKLVADSVAFAYSGTAAGLLYNKSIVGGSGSFSFSLADADLAYELGITKIRIGSTKLTNVKLGNFTIYEVYHGATQVWGRARPLNMINAERGTFTYSGTDATMIRGRKMTANGTSYSLSGTANALKYGRRMIADGATYTFTGTAATLTGLIPTGFTYTDDVIGVGTVQASLELVSNGTASYSTGAAQSWYSPATTNIGASYWAELVAVSGTGTMSGSALSTRIQISGNPQWILTRSTLGVSSRTFTLNIYDASTGGNLLSSGTLTLTAESS